MIPQRSAGSPVMKETRKRQLMQIALPLALALGCTSTSEVASSPGVQGKSDQVTGEDGLADAYATFKQLMSMFGFDQRFPIGYAFHPGLVTTPVSFNGKHPNGNAIID